MKRWGRGHRLDLTGMRFGRLLVLRPADSRKSTWFCVCDCGNSKTIRSSTTLNMGQTRSCGCLRRESVRAARLLHGATSRGRQTPEYAAFCRAKSRCENPRNPNYPRYGGRPDLPVEMRFTFEEWYAELGPRPSPKHSVDRWPDPWGHYEPGNVRWATAKEQLANRRKPRRTTPKEQARNRSKVWWQAFQTLHRYCTGDKIPC